MVLSSFKYGKTSPLNQPSRPSSDPFSNTYVTYKKCHQLPHVRNTMICTVHGLIFIEMCPPMFIF